MMTHTPTSNNDTKEISIERIYWIFGNAYETLVKQEDKEQHPYNSDCYKDSHTNEEMRGYMREKIDKYGDKIWTYDYESYIRRVVARCQEYGLEKNKHVIIEKDPAKVDFDGLKEPYYARYKITIKNLRINVGVESTDMFFNNVLSGGPEYPHGKSKTMSNVYKDGLYIVFDSNHFVRRFPDKNCYFSIFFHRDSCLIFQNNTFDVEMFMYPGQNAFAKLEKNKFNVRKLKIIGQAEATLGQGYGGPYGYYSSTNAEIARHYEEWVNEHVKVGEKNLRATLAEIKEKIGGEDDVDIKDILKMLFYIDQKIAVNSDDVEKRRTDAIVLLVDNAINKLEIYHASFYFNGTNTIHSLNIDPSIKNLHWGPYQNIDPKGNNPDSNKKVFLYFMGRAAKDNDSTQEARLRRESIKCEKALLRREKFSSAWQDKLILWWGWGVSNHGLWWFLPFLWLAVINGIWATMFYFSFCSADWRALFIELFNPLSDVSDGMNSKSPWMTSLLIVIQKGLLATLYYEMIKIFRRFSK